jgi:2-polyprenyl-3-methyl-5-hydroxy-6-metoxy-1,4-benzoquinol methylase
MIVLKTCPLCDSSDIYHHMTSKDYFLTQEAFTIDSCQNCKLRFTNPRPQTTNLSKYYQSDNYISHSNQSNGLINRLYQIVRKRTLQQKFRLLSKHLSNQVGIQHLDYGCGTGHFIHFAAKRGWKSIGYEPDNRALTLPNPLIFNSLDSVNSNAPYDVITLFHVLEHVGDLNKTIDNLLAMLKTDGILLLALPNPESYDAQHYQEQWAGYDLPRHLYHFNQKSVRYLAQKHGIRIEEISAMVYDSFYVSMLSEKYRDAKARFIKGITRGLISNMSATRNMQYSSLIYIIRK